MDIWETYSYRKVTLTVPPPIPFSTIKPRLVPGVLEPREKLKGKDKREKKEGVENTGKQKKTKK